MNKKQVFYFWESFTQNEIPRVESKVKDWKNAKRPENTEEQDHSYVWLA